jgi:hypothetical protein
MGHELKGGDDLNPKGYYEDIISHGLVRQMTEFVVSINKYLEIMNKQHASCPSWGAKDPWFLFLPDEWKKYLRPQLAIICHRNIDDTVKSWLKVYQKGGTGEIKTPGGEANDEVVQGYVNLTKHRHDLCMKSKDVWRNNLVINFDTPQDEASITARIKAKLVG